MGVILRELMRRRYQWHPCCVVGRDLQPTADHKGHMAGLSIQKMRGLWGEVWHDAC